MNHSGIYGPFVRSHVAMKRTAWHPVLCDRDDPLHILLSEVLFLFPWATVTLSDLGKELAGVLRIS